MYPKPIYSVVTSGGTNQTDWTDYEATNRNASNLGVGGATSDYLAITGVQLEVGEVATPFEHRSYGEELLLCQRYFFKHSGTSSSESRYSYGENFHYFYPVEMRTDASISGANVSINRRFKDGVTFNPYTGNLGLFSADAEL